MPLSMICGGIGAWISRLTSAADPLAAHVPLNLEHARRVIEFLAHILADSLQSATAAALRLFGLVADFAAREAMAGSATRRGFSFGGTADLCLSASISRLIASMSASMLSSRSERCTGSICSLLRSKRQRFKIAISCVSWSIFSCLALSS